MNEYIFACFLKKPYNYRSMKKISLILSFVLISNLSFSQAHKFQSLIIYSITKYVVWPESYNQGDFEILVLGDCPILEELKAMAQAKKIGDRSIKVTKIGKTDEIRKCNILYVPASKSGQFDEILAKVNTQSILIVSEEPGLGAKGSDINFIVKDGKLAFEINQAAVNKQSLKVSNELTRLAILI